MKNLRYIFLLLCLFSFKQEDPILPNKVGKFNLAKGVTAKDYLPNTIIVKFKSAGGNQQAKIASNVTKQLNVSGVVINKLSKMFASTLADSEINLQKANPKIDLTGIYVAIYSGNESITTVINMLLADPQILYAEPSYVYHTTYVPNDASYGNQLYLPQVKAPQAWDVLKNASNVIIGIVDSGSDLQHEDLAANIYRNTADPVNGLDDDGDGFIDNYQGWDFVGNSAATMTADNNPDVTSDTTDHGVHVSGLASAVTDNGKGVASIAFNAKLLIVKVGADNNARSIYRGYEGIKYAADHGAKIINCSWGGPGGGQFGQQMIDYAVAKGCLIVAAAGNDNTETPDYPAAFDGVLSVASLTSTDRKSSFSNYGFTVDIAAPGSSILNTVNGNRYANYSGTSMASPLVASAAALVKAKYPSYTGLQIGEVLKVTADPIDAVNASFVGKLGQGRLNVLRAITETAYSVNYQNLSINDQTNGSRAAGDVISLKFDLKNFLAPVSGLNVNITSNSAFVQVLDPNIAAGNLASLENKTNLAAVRVKILPNAPQNQDVIFKLTYTGNSGAYTASEQFTITVALDYLNITANKISTTFTSNGRVGYSKADAVNGLGFIYKDENMLYEGALIIASSAIQVSNNARETTTYSEDFASQITAAKQAGTQAAFEANATFTDNNSTNPLKVSVKSTMLAFSQAPDDKYVIVQYEIFNKNTTALQGIYTGLFTDYDLDESSANATEYNASTKTAYVYAKKNTSYPYAGVKLLTSLAPAAYYPLSYQIAGNFLADNNFTKAEKYQTLSSGIFANGLGQNTTNGNDVMFVTGTGPYNIPINGSIKVAYAFIAGDNLTDMLNTGTAAQTKYNTLAIAVIPPVIIPTSFLLNQNYPNPAKDKTEISFSLTIKTVVTLTITDVSGKLITTLLNETRNAGQYNLTADVSKLQTGIYLYNLKADGFKKTLKMIVVK